MKKVLLAVLAAVVMFSFPQLSASEIKEGSIEISPFVGYYFLDAHEKDKGGFGLRAGYNFTKNLELEGAYDYAGSRAEFLRADLLYHIIPDKEFNPFIFAGIGNAHMKPGDDSYNHILGEIGAGFKYFLRDDLAIRVDVRDIQEKYNNVAVTAGLVFAFGGKAPKHVETAAPEMKPEPKPVPPQPAPEPEPAPPPPPVKVIDRLTIHVNFDFDKSNIRQADKAELKKAIDFIRKYPDAIVDLQGHTDSIGTEQYNQKLSERRAEAVRQYLIKEGAVDQARISTRGYGESRPIAPNRTKEGKDNPQGRAENRRVEILIVSE
jgi:OOP family OmpA-OmpF porin